MNLKFSSRWLLKLCLWSLMAALLSLAMLLPLDGTTISWDEGDHWASAQTIPPVRIPPDDDDGDDGTPPPTSTPEGTPPSGGGASLPLCECFVTPPDVPEARVDFLSVITQPNVPPLTGSGLFALVHATDVVTRARPMPVPDGMIQPAIGVVHFDLNLTHYATLVLEPDRERDILVRIQVFPQNGAPIPLDRPNVIVGFPPISKITGVLHVFTINLYYADTGEEIHIHNPDLILAICLRNEYSPDTPILLRFNDELQQYEIPFQNYGVPTRVLVGYPPETSIFVIARASGPVPQLGILKLPKLVISAQPKKDRSPCLCLKEPAGAPVTGVTLLDGPPVPQIPPLTGNGILAHIIAMPPIPSLQPIPIPSGVINQPVAPIHFMLDGIGEADIAPSSLVVPTDKARAKVARVQSLPILSLPKPVVNTPESVLGMPVGSNVTRLLHFLDLKIFFEDGEELHGHNPELVLAICIPGDYNPDTPVLLRYDETLQLYVAPPQIYNYFTRCLVGYLHQTSKFVVVTISGELPALTGPGGNRLIGPVIPAGLPRTGELPVAADPTRIWQILALVGLGVVTAAGGAWRLRTVRQNV
jgi:hypothetical protein